MPVLPRLEWVGAARCREVGLAVRGHGSSTKCVQPPLGAGPVAACARLIYLGLILLGPLLLGLLFLVDGVAAAPVEGSGGGTLIQESVSQTVVDDAGGTAQAAVADGSSIGVGDVELRFGRWPALVSRDLIDGIDWSAVDGPTVGDLGSLVSPAVVVPDPIPSTGSGGRQRRHVLDPNPEFGRRLRRVSHWNLASNDGPAGRWVMWEERFFDVRDVGWGPENGFDQSRAFVGWAWLTGPSAESDATGRGRLGSTPRLPGLGRPTRVEFGYLNQTIDRPGRDADQRLHFFSFNLFF